MVHSRPTILGVTRVNVEGVSQSFQFTLARPADRYNSPTEPVVIIKVSAPMISTHCEMIAQAVHLMNRGKEPLVAGMRKLGTAGSNLCNELFPEKMAAEVRELRQSLLAIKEPLLITSDDQSIFWELLQDGKSGGECLALRCDIGRRLKTRPVPPSIPRTTSQLRCLIISNPNCGDYLNALPNSSNEARKLREWLISKGVNCSDYLEGEEATLPEVLDRLGSEEYDLIHYAGHTVYDETSNEYALALSNDAFLPASSIRNHVRGTPLVFLNSCWTGEAAGVTSIVGSVEGMTDAFLAAGAQIVIGALFEVPDNGARLFAEKFYERILAGRPVGEAVRLARIHVKSLPETGATWASYVLYGDPCVTVEAKKDVLKDLLEKVGLSRDQFDVASLRVIQQALDYSQPTAHVTSIELFAALLSSDDRTLRDRLRAQGASPEKMKRAFSRILTEVNTGIGPGKGPALSESVEKVLTAAVQRAILSRGGRISEIHLIGAFVEYGGGTVWDLLKQLNVDVKKLQDDRTAIGSDVSDTESAGQSDPNLRFRGSDDDSAVRLGSNGDSNPNWFDAERFDDPARHILEIAQGFSGLSRFRLVEEQHLLAGMLHVRQSALRAALERLGANVNQIAALLQVNLAWSPSEQAMVAGRKSGISPRVASILHDASQIAAAHGSAVVRDSDLLLAVLTHKNGWICRRLSDMGYPPQVLVSRLFGVQGELLVECFCESAAKLVMRAQRFAAEKRQSKLERKHLMFAMLATADGLFAKQVDAQGLNSDRLADLLDVAISAGNGSADIHAFNKFSGMASTIVKILCDAEELAASAMDEKISDIHLIRAGLADGCGSAGTFVVERGVRWRELKKLIGSLTQGNSH